MIPHAAIFRDVHRVDPVFVDAVIDADESLDLTAAALEEDDPVLERSRLVTRGFRHGRTIRWITRTDQPIVVSLTVHELASTSEALLSVADHFETLRAAAAILESPTTTLVSGYMDDSDSRLHIQSEAVSHFHITIAATFRPGQLDVARFRAVANSQRELLSGLLK
jgi:hypothetical protein